MFMEKKKNKLLSKKERFLTIFLISLTVIMLIATVFSLAYFRKLITDNDSGRLKDKLDQIKQHTLIIWGLEDTIIPVEQGYRLEQAISGSSLVVINNAGHLPFLEKPEDVLSAIKSFID